MQDLRSSKPTPEKGSVFGDADVEALKGHFIAMANLARRALVILDTTNISGHAAARTNNLMLDLAATIEAIQSLLASHNNVAREEKKPESPPAKSIEPVSEEKPSRQHRPGRA